MINMMYVVTHCQSQAHTLKSNERLEEAQTQETTNYLHKQKRVFMNKSGV